MIGKTAQQCRPDENAAQGGGGDGPFSAAPRLNSRTIRGSATPVMKTTSPSKNLPAVARIQMRHCITVIGVKFTSVLSAQNGVSSM